MTAAGATLPLLKRHAGVWRGVYTHIAPDLSPIDAHHFRIHAETPDEPACAYRQTSHYWWTDGRTQDLLFEAKLDTARDRLVWDNGRIAGGMWAISDDTLYLDFGFAADKSRICEMIQLAPSGVTRARTWHWFDAAGKLVKITLVNEAREDAP